MGLWTGLFVTVLAIALAYYQYKSTNALPYPIDGTVESKFVRVKEAFRSILDDDTTGAAFAVYHRGKLVVDLWGGYANHTEQKPWQEDTVNLLMSVTKGLGALCVALLVDRGHLQYDKPVAQYWPEFGQNGKEKITIRQLLNHEAGLVVLDEKINLEDFMSNDPRVSQILSRQKPNWNVEEYVHGYHLMTFGLYIDQLVRRGDPKRRALHQFFHEEIAQPLGLDTSIGLPNRFLSRRTHVLQASLFDLVSSWSVNWMRYFYAAFTNASSIQAGGMNIFHKPLFVEDWPNDVDNLLRYPLGATTGFSTARSLAKLLANLVSTDGKGVGTRILSQKTLDTMLQFGPARPDVVAFANFSMASGLVVLMNPKKEPIFGHPGTGGQFVFLDPSRDLAWAFLTNHHRLYDFGKDYRYNAVLEALYRCVR